MVDWLYIKIISIFLKKKNLDILEEEREIGIVSPELVFPRRQGRKYKN